MKYEPGMLVLDVRRERLLILIVRDVIFADNGKILTPYWSIFDKREVKLETEWYLDKFCKIIEQT